MMIEKLEECPKCGDILVGTYYDMQSHSCGWSYTDSFDRTTSPAYKPRTTIDLPIPHDPAERERQRTKRAAIEDTHVEWLPNAIELTDELLASIAISLKRIADSMGERAGRSRCLPTRAAGVCMTDHNFINRLIDEWMAEFSPPDRPLLTITARNRLVVALQDAARAARIEALQNATYTLQALIDRDPGILRSIDALKRLVDRAAKGYENE